MSKPTFSMIAIVPDDTHPNGFARYMCMTWKEVTDRIGEETETGWQPKPGHAFEISLIDDDRNAEPYLLAYDKNGAFMGDGERVKTMRKVLEDSARKKGKA